MEKQPTGIYIHVPFCVKKCCYCDFYSITDLSLRRDFIDALIREIEMAPDPGPADSLYIGGGTPSVLDPAEIERVVAAVLERFSFNPDSEITLEVNPGTVDQEKLPGFKAAGINRLNIGVQSFNKEALAFLGRIHTAEESTRVVEAARTAGFDNLGLDLIYGLPGQTAEELYRDLEKAADFNPEHLSCYLLTYEKGTPLDRERERGLVQPLSESRAADFFLMTRGLLENLGYAQYEIASFARSERYRSRHNRKYWTFAPYIGLGPAAHSFLEPKRYWNHGDLGEYLADLENGRLPVEAKEILDESQQMIEAIYLGLRQTRGILVPDFNKRFTVEFETLFEPVLSDPGLKKLLEMRADFCRLTPQGMLVMDSIVARLVDLIQ
jgi:oxygen-independent coproporphyrinogen-3 oxidase